MRKSILGLAGLLLAGAFTTPLAASTRERDRPRGPRASAAAVAAAAHFLCPHGGAPVASRRGRGRCRPGSGGGAGGFAPAGFSAEEMDVAGWDAGIAAPGHRQAPCPPGTAAVPALAQPQVVRCVAE